MFQKNKITEILNIHYPIVQAPMFGVTTPEMVATAANMGCLGSLALGNLSAEACCEAIQATKKLTNKMFAVNIFVNTIPPISEELQKQYSNTKCFLTQFAQQNGLHVVLPEINEITITDYHSQIDAIISEGCKLVSFTFGVPDKESIQKLKANKIKLIGTCTSVSEALELKKTGIDILCVQGFEAGGHRGSFASDDIPKIGGFALLPQVKARVNLPIIYAGGIYNASTLLAAKTLGAEGFQIGSMLLSSAESGLREFEKKYLREISDNKIVVTKSFSGRYARGIKNKFIETIENSDYILPYPYQNKLTSPLRKHAKLMKNTDFISIWVSQSIKNFSTQSTSEIIRKLLSDVEKRNSEQRKS